MADFDQLYELITKEKDRLDILFANAAIFEITPLAAVTEKHVDDTFNITIKDLLFNVQKALLIFANSGSIKAYPNESVYSALKAAVRSFARCWTVDLKDRKIRVNPLSPGSIDTPILRNMTDTKEERNAYIKLCAAALLGEIARTSVFLSSDDSSCITGIELFVDCGMGQI